MKVSQLQDSCVERLHKSELRSFPNKEKRVPRAQCCLRCSRNLRLFVPLVPLVLYHCIANAKRRKREATYLLGLMTMTQRSTELLALFRVVGRCLFSCSDRVLQTQNTYYVVHVADVDAAASSCVRPQFRSERSDAICTSIPYG